MKLGVVGCGLVAEGFHLPALNKIEDIEIAAVCDNDIKNAKRVKETFNIDKYYTNFTEMLNQENLDIVDICTPPKLHAEMAIQSIENGCHVLLEKPMTSSVYEADMVLRALRHNSDVKLCIVHNYLYKPIAMKARSIVESGELGDIVSMDVKFLDKFDTTRFWEKGHWSHAFPGGRFSENIIHPLYLINKFMGDSDVLTAVAKKISDYEWVSIDELKVMLDCDNSVGTISMSSNSPRDLTSVDIYGTKMNLHFDFSSLIKYKPEKYSASSSRYYRYLLGTVDNTINTSKIFAGEISRTISYPLKSSTRNKYIRSGHFYLIKEFIESIKNDRIPPVTGEEARNVMALQEKIFELALH